MKLFKKYIYYLKKIPEFVSGSLRRFKKSKKTHILLKKPGVRVRQPPAVRKSTKNTYFIKKTRSSCQAASGGSKILKKHIFY